MNDKTNPYESPRESSRVGEQPTLVRKAVGLLRLAVPLLFPTGFCYLYQPINERWTVRTFGCGCPNLDGSPRFDANDFNMIVMGAVCLACLGQWISRLGILPQNLRLLFGVEGAVVIVTTSLFAYGQMIWG